MKGLGPRILLMGGNYRALCVLERLLDRGERVVAFIGEEGSGERDFCPEILEACDRAAVPARSGRKLGEEIVRWLEDRIRPDLAISVGLRTEVPLAIGGNCRLGLIEVIDTIHEDHATVTLRQSGTTMLNQSLPLPVQDDDSAGDLFLQLAETTLLLLDEYLDQIGDRHARPLVSIPYEPVSSPCESKIAQGAELERGTDRLETAVAEYLGASNVLAVRSPIEGAQLVLESLELPSGSEVLFPGIASQAFLSAARQAGLRVRFVDVDGRSLTLDPQRLQETLTDRTRAVVVSHAFGQPADLDAIRALTNARGVPLIEDAAAALGAWCGDHRVGAAPSLCLSSLPVSARSDGLRPTFVSCAAERWTSVRAHADELRLSNSDAVQALEDFARLEDELSARRTNASAYSSELVRFDAFTVPYTPEGRLPTYGAYVLRITSFARTSADDLARLLAECGVETRMIAAVGSDRELSDAPIAERIRSSALLLPISSALTPELQALVLDAIFDYAIG